MTEPVNVLFLLSDEHSASFLGSAGHPIVQTPNLDALAARGTRFSNAYTPCPICVPARAALATGRYVHDIGAWCNASPYDGSPPSWAARIAADGHSVTSIGKLHYRNDTVTGGFTEARIPMHVRDGVGDLLGAVRDPLPVREKTRTLSEELGPGESAYTRYDRAITAEAETWLTETAPGLAEPWVLQVGLVAPHFPLIAPPEHFALYRPEDMPLPKARLPADWPDHPWFDAMRACFVWDRFFDDDKRRLAIASYLGLCSFLDHNIGRILAALSASGLAERTLVVYASDHGDNLGARGLWGKSNGYEESAAAPLILAGPGVPEGRIVRTAATLLDIFPTFLDATGTPNHPDDADLPGQSLLVLATSPDDPERAVMSEYHAAGALSGMFMLRRGRYKYVHYVGLPPQLFDLEADPDELADLAHIPKMAGTLAELEAALRAICDPEQIDARARRDQAALVARLGGRDAIVSAGVHGATPPPKLVADPAV